MLLETYAAHRGISYEALIENFVILKIFNSTTQRPKKIYVDKGLFKEDGTIIDVSAVDRLVLIK